MPPKMRDRVEDVHDHENLRHLEQRLDQLDQKMEQLTQQMAALLENQNQRNPNLNFDPDREEIEYDSNFEGAGGDGEPKFDDEEETVTGIGIGAAVMITKSIKELRDLGECLPNLDSGNRGGNSCRVVFIHIVSKRVRVIEVITRTRHYY
ncbi:hypothetical protein CDL15_Pgr013030 [Punica granatum]|uniref:Uncharacterized protein n=1 Tax=Punica granatum TaxID=22663 RepID=A0A218XFH8_PUNGR|nr:hypothetical protein CDL15_Pgr013030 [Punica granatum]